MIDIWNFIDVKELYLIIFVAAPLKSSGMQAQAAATIQFGSVGATFSRDLGLVSESDPVIT
jgi:hypothetical protein